MIGPTIVGPPFIVPLYGLYEISVLIASIVWRRRNSDADGVAVLLAPLLAMRAIARSGMRASKPRSRPIAG